MANPLEPPGFSSGTDGCEFLAAGAAGRGVAGCGRPGPPRFGELRADRRTDAQVWSIVELWDFGVAADITPPGPDEVLAPAEAYHLAEEDQPGQEP